MKPKQFQFLTRKHFHFANQCRSTQQDYSYNGRNINTVNKYTKKKMKLLSESYYELYLSRNQKLKT